MKNLIQFIKKNWLLFVVLIQPILDIVSYFQTKFIGNSYSWIIRILILFIIFLVTFIKIKDKKKLILYISQFIIFLVLHLGNLYRIGSLNVVQDIKYCILVFQMPILTILLIQYLENCSNSLRKLKDGMVVGYVIILISLFISLVTNTYELTYEIGGITGWFSSPNTASMILCVLAPWSIYYFYKKGNILVYIITLLITMLVLYFNATKACYMTLIASYFLLFGFSVIKNNKKKAIIALIFLIASIGLYGFSITDLRSSEEKRVNEENQKSIDELVDFDKINLNDDEEVLEVIKLSYIYKELINIHGEEKIINIMRNNLSAETLSDNRYRKKINAKIYYQDSDVFTKLFGIGYSTIGKNELDLENDFTAIFYYYGIIGFVIYVSFILYFIFKAGVCFYKNPLMIQDTEFIFSAFIIALLIFGGEYTGAFFRKPNANIYFSILLTVLYFKIYKHNSSNIKLKNKKISFILLHLGYGGIETSTINTANALCNDYEVELVAFYNLKNNQCDLINPKIKIKYLYDGGPNKQELFEAIKKVRPLKLIREGFKSIKILFLKKWLMVKYIYYCDSKNVVSTRYDYSVLLSKYGNQHAIKIAQEHHHHNNNKKYINILSKKYNNIDYLCALTNSLKKDYISFLKNNSHTKIILLPNMIIKSNNTISKMTNKNIISVGRLHKGKRIHELVEIFNEITDKKSKLFIIGDGEQKNNIQNLINSYKLNDRIIMLGYLNKEQQKEYYLNSCLFAMTSETEGLPMVLLEAMEYGIPCIAYKTESGISDIINNNVNGFVINKRNKDKYIESINKYLKDINLRKKYSKNCIKTVDNFSSTNILKIWNRILK